MSPKTPRHDFEYLDKPCFVILDTKNAASDLRVKLQRDGFSVSHFYAQESDGQAYIIRAGTGSDVWGKGNDFSENYREYEIECILEQHSRSNVLAVIMPKTFWNDTDLRLDVANKLKERCRDLIIIFEGRGIETDINDGVIKSVAESELEEAKTGLMLKKSGTLGTILHRDVDYYSGDLSRQKAGLAELLTELAGQSKRR